MQHLISNSLNEKSIINNINNQTLNKIILLEGRYGTGKSEFAKQIAKMIICENLTENGYCGECRYCKKEIVYGTSSFDADIHFLNMKKVTYQDMVNLINQSVNQLRSRQQVKILDEFHLVDKDTQDLWLAETARLEDCTLILTTTDKRGISDGIISRSVPLPMKQLAPLESKMLIASNYPGVSEVVSEAIVKRIGGCPRELINISTFYAGAGLSDQEILDHLANANQSELVMLLESLTNRELFFEQFRTIRTLSSYTVKVVLQDLLWDYIGSSPQDRAKLKHFNGFTESQILNFLADSNVDPFLAIMKMFKMKTIRTADKPNEEAVVKVVTESVKTEPALQKKDRW